MAGTVAGNGLGEGAAHGLAPRREGLAEAAGEVLEIAAAALVVLGLLQQDRAGGVARDVRRSALFALALLVALRRSSLHVPAIMSGERARFASWLVRRQPSARAN